MQETNIKFSGLALTPYSDISPDGQLASCVGLEMHNGSLRPSLLQGTEYSIRQPEGVSLKLLHMHSTSSYDNLIFQGSDGLLYWSVESADMQPVQVSGVTQQATSVKSVGNVLVAQTPQGPHYSIFENGTYRYMGQKPPELKISFGITGDSRPYFTEKEVSFQTNTVLGYNILDQVAAADAAYGAINTLMDTYKEGIFYPFFVRAAYRYVDGSYMMCSSPVLLIPDTRGPRAFLDKATIETKSENGTNTVTVKGLLSAEAILSRIVFQVMDASGLNDWREVIAGVDVFMTPGVNPVDVGKAIEYLKAPLSMPSSWGQYGLSGVYEERQFEYRLETAYFKLPEKEQETFIEELLSAQFYRVKSWPLEEYKTLVGKVRQPLELDIKLGELVFSETLSEAEDYHAHDMIVANGSLLYNSRLHLYGLSRQIFSGFVPETMWAFTSTGNTSYTIQTYITSPDGQSVTVKAQSGVSSLLPVSRFYYYPDTSAVRMVVYDNSGSPVFDLPLKPHPYLNGSYYLNMDSLPGVPGNAPSLVGNQAAPVVKMLNKIYISPVNNPFRFPVSGVYTVGNSPVIGISSIVTPLSPGQYGIFDLMVFTEEGNYTFSVTEEGKYSNAKPMQRDVCINPKSIVPTDHELIYISDKGVMSADGSIISCLSEVLDGEMDPFVLGFFPSPRDLFRTCLIAYDYSGGRLIFGSETGGYVYVRSKDGLWSQAEWGTFTSVLNVYPYSYIQQGNTIKKLDKAYSHTTSVKSGRIVTRPMRLGTLQQKKIHQLRMEGDVLKNVEISLYGSHDTNEWHFIGKTGSRNIGALSGRSYKYWRIDASVSMDVGLNVTGFRILFQEKKEKRYR